MKHVCAKSLRYLRISLVSVVLFQLSFGGLLAVGLPRPTAAATTTVEPT